MNTCKKAFSLIELSVVLAIIGALAGGVMATSSYLKTAKMNATVMDGKYYINAFNQFQTKYGGALPGDLSNPADYWSGSGAFAGNGDGQINQSGENFFAFKQLQLAGMISGNYTGMPAAPMFSANAGVNVPALSMEGVGATFATVGDVISTSVYFAGSYGTPLMVGRGWPGKATYKGFITPNEGMELDQKYDDGRADSGWIRALASTTFGNCVNGGTQYALNSPAPNDACTFIMVFN